VADRLEIRCDCGHHETVGVGDVPGEMSIGTYADWLASNHNVDCPEGTAAVASVPDIEAETTKYSTGGILDG